MIATPLGGKDLTSLFSSAGDYTSTTDSCHAGTEAVFILSFSAAGLKRAFHFHSIFSPENYEMIQCLSKENNLTKKVVKSWGKRSVHSNFFE